MVGGTLRRTVAAAALLALVALAAAPVAQAAPWTASRPSADQMSFVDALDLVVKLWSWWGAPAPQDDASIGAATAAKLTADGATTEGGGSGEGDGTDETTRATLDPLGVS